MTVLQKKKSKTKKPHKRLENRGARKQGGMTWGHVALAQKTLGFVLQKPARCTAFVYGRIFAACLPVTPSFLLSFSVDRREEQPADPQKNCRSRERHPTAVQQESMRASV